MPTGFYNPIPEPVGADPESFKRTFSVLEAKLNASPRSAACDNPQPL